KIEGRMKTEYYVAVVTGAYRRALDLLAQGEDAFRAALPGLLAELTCASHRESDTGFALAHPQQPGGAEGFHQEREYIARVMEPAAAGTPARLMLKNRFHAGDTLEVMTARGVFPVEATAFLREKTGETLDTLGVAGEMIRMTLPIDVAEGDLIRGEVRNHRK
ncbi:MAG: U32 family peptidase C-terminal domain-containing protein, partial [Clostridia bacterium]|nr:U32 family peptidase C-terminal domain-containing protein [Clostridia bacterium]